MLVVRNRRCQHKRRCQIVDDKYYNLRVYQYIRANGGWGNWSMIELERIEYERKPQLRARERYHMEQLGATLNSRTPNRTGAEWRQDNAEHIKQRQKQHYQNTKETIKQYYQDNHDHIKQQKIGYYHENKGKLNKKYACECGGQYTHQNKTRHLKSPKHQQLAL